MVTDRQYVPPDVDISVPSPARMYDYYLGGKENYPADREAAERALSVVPHGRAIAWANRKFLVRTVKHLARNGIRQFIDLGTGIPTSPNVHESVRSVVLDARVAYVDNDPIVAVHNKALLASLDNGITSIRGDIRYPLNIMANHTLREVIDFDRPIGVLFVAVLHFVTNAENPYASVAAFRDRIPSGSCVVISHITSDGTEPTVISTIQEAYRGASAPAVFRSRKEIEELFTGLDLLKPGLVEVSDWRASGTKSKKPPALRFLGGVGRKPRQMLNYTKDESVVDDVRTKTDALERLADELRARGFQTDLVTPVGKRAYLHVRNPQAGMLAENIVSEAGWYWYSWAERIASIHEVVRAAEKISRVLSATSGERDPAI